MTNEEFPGKQNPAEEDIFNKGKEEKIPEYIYIDSKENFSQEEPFSTHYEHKEHRYSFEQLAHKEYPFVLRIVCLFVASLVLSFTALVLFLFMIFFFANAVTFFHFENFWKGTKQLWEQIKKLFVCGLGLTVAVVSPAFGLSMIMLYFVVKGSNMNEDWVSRTMKDQFYR